MRVFIYLEMVIDHLIKSYLLWDEDVEDPACDQIEEFFIEFLVEQPGADAHYAMASALWNHGDVESPTDRSKRRYPPRVWRTMRRATERAIDSNNRDALQGFAAYWYEHLMDEPAYLRRFLTNTPPVTTVKAVLGQRDHMYIDDGAFESLCKAVVDLVPQRDRRPFCAWLRDELGIILYSAG